MINVPFINMGESQLIRKEVLKFITSSMNGLDIGSAGSPIIPQAVSLDRVNGHFTDNVQLRGNADNLKWFTDNCLDYIFSSHCYEDFTPQEKPRILLEWSRVIKIGGYILLYLPDEQEFIKHCAQTGQNRNYDHKDPYFSLTSVQNIVKNHPILTQRLKEVFTISKHEAYSFFVVYQKIGI